MTGSLVSELQFLSAFTFLFIPRQLPVTVIAKGWSRGMLAGTPFNQLLFFDDNWYRKKRASHMGIVAEWLSSAEST